MSGELEGKSILLIAPRFFGYEGRICDEIASRGADVDFYNDRVFDHPLFKVILRLKLNFIVWPIVHLFFRKILTRNDYDYVLVISPEGLPYGWVENARTKLPKATFVLYMWDSFLNKPKGAKLAPLFDRVLSFDKKDCEKTEEVLFRPLFFTAKDSVKCQQQQADESIDLCFAGSLHGDRYNVVERIKSEAISKDISFYSFYFFSNKMVLKLLKCLSRNFKSVDVDHVSFKPLSYQEFLSLMQSSRAIVDIQSESQSGLTMRTLEVLAMGKKFITTNEEVLKYDFFHPDNIYVVDRFDPILNPVFFEKRYQPIDSEILDRYSAAYWLDEVLGLRD
ncbi:MAG: hypothetical protein ACRBB4_02220 [Neptuniibacter sp.]